MKDEELNRLVHEIGPVEGMPVVTDPGILSPEAFVDEVINVRIPNPFMPDTPQRIATDTSQKVGIRYGETIKAYVAQYGDAEKLKAIPLAIAGWCRYLLGVDDKPHQPKVTIIEYLQNHTVIRFQLVFQEIKLMHETFLF